jgi:hypothetical protein
MAGGATIGGAIRRPDTAIPEGPALADVAAMPAAQTAAVNVLSQFLRTTMSPCSRWSFVAIS